MIDVNNISFHYQGSRHEVFSDFSLSLAPGRIYGLLGKNGTGKSTLLYLISGLLRPESGTVSVDGKESLLRQPEMLQEIFIVPEEYAMPDMSFKAFADMMRTFYPHFSDELLDKCLADFEMPAEPNLKELSMGQKKKVYMSFAIATGTRLLMMDEPTNGLDIPSKALFRKVVASHRLTTARSSSRPTRCTTSRPCSTMSSSSTRAVCCSMPPSPASLIATPSVWSRHKRWTTPSSMPNLRCQGNAVIMLRGEGEEETQVNLELLFNATIGGKITNK